MVDTRLIIILAVVLIIVVAVVFWPHSAPSKTGTYVPPSNTGTKINGTTTTIAPAHVQFYAVNYQWIYSGPATQNGRTCYYYTYTTYYTYGLVLNGSEAFDLNFFPVSNGYCGYVITSINSSTSGFAVTSVQPKLPFALPAGYSGSKAELQINMISPDVNFYGPLTITIHYS